MERNGVGFVDKIDEELKVVGLKLGPEEISNEGRIVGLLDGIDVGLEVVPDVGVFLGLKEGNTVLVMKEGESEVR